MAKKSNSTHQNLFIKSYKDLYTQFTIGNASSHMTHNYAQLIQKYLRILKHVQTICCISNASHMIIIFSNSTHISNPIIKKHQSQTLFLSCHFRHFVADYKVSNKFQVTFQRSWQKHFHTIHSSVLYRFEMPFLWHPINKSSRERSQLNCQLLFPLMIIKDKWCEC